MCAECVEDGEDKDGEDVADCLGDNVGYGALLLLLLLLLLIGFDFLEKIEDADWHGQLGGESDELAVAGGYEDWFDEEP